MAKILILAPTGFGKSTSILRVPQYGLIGLDPENTYVVSATSKPLPGAGTGKLYPVMPNFSLKSTGPDVMNYRRIILQGGPVGNPGLLAHAIKILAQSKKIVNIVSDDLNYIMQDYYMNKAMAQGWDAPKKIGFDMGKIFEAIETVGENKNFIALAHFEEYSKADGRIGMRMKTTGKMVQEYITPEGKFDIVLFGHSYYDEVNRVPRKVFVTNDDGLYSSAKSPIGMFGNLYINNDLGYVTKRVTEYYEEGIVEEAQVSTYSSISVDDAPVAETVVPSGDENLTDDEEQQETPPANGEEY